MTSHEARELFSAAYDGQLEAPLQAEFEAALERDPALAAEFSEFRELLVLAGSEVPPAETPDLLAGVQRRLRARSRGRFYRDRFAERAGLGKMTPLWVAGGIALLCAVVWFALYFLRTIDM